MGVINRIFGRRQERAANIIQLAQGQLSLSSIAFNVTTNATAEACIKKISSTLAGLNLTLYTHRRGGGRTPFFGDPLFIALRNPDPTVTPTLWYTQMYDAILRHGGAVILPKAVAGQIFFELFDPNHTTINIENGKRVFHYGGQTYIEPQVLYIPYPIIVNGIGRSPIDQYSDLIALDNVLTVYIREFFRNSVGKRTVIELGDDYKLKSIEQLQSLVIPWVSKFVQGAENSGKPLIPPPGSKIGVHDTTQNLYDDLKSLKMLVEREISQSFGVPYSLISETNKYDSLEANQLQFMTDACIPIGTHVEESFNRLIPAGSSNLYCKYDYKEMLQSDIKTTVDYLAKEVLAGLMTINEARDKLDMDAVEAGDYTLVPANMWPLTVDNANAFFAQAKKTISDGSNHNPAGDEKK